MPQLPVKDVLLDVMEALKRRFYSNGRRSAAWRRGFSGQALKAEECFRAGAGQLREETHGRIVRESADLIREDRDSR